MEIKILIKKDDLDKISSIGNIVKATDDWEIRCESEEVFYHVTNELINLDINYESDKLRIVSDLGKEVVTEVEEDNNLYCERSVLVVDKEVLGHGDYEHSITLMKKYFEFWSNNQCVPSHILFFNSGVKLLTTNSNVIESIKLLKEKGASIIYSTESVDFYNFQKHIEQDLGQGVTMDEIISIQMSMEKIIKI